MACSRMSRFGLDSMAQKFVGDEISKVVKFAQTAQ